MKNTKDSMKKLTLDALIAKKEQREANQTEYREVPVESLGGTLTIKKLPLSQMLELMDAQDENAGMKENVEFEVELIYRCCPMFQDKKLQAAYECAEPYDVVYRVMDDDLGAIGELSTAILDFYGMGDSVREQLKNG